MMPLFRRYARPGLLGRLSGSDVVSGTPAMMLRVEDLRTADMTAETPTFSAVDGTPLADQFTALTALHSSGDISDEEFTLAKARLLRE